MIFNPWKEIKKLNVLLKIENQEHEETEEFLTMENKSLRESIENLRISPMAGEVIEKIIKRGINWYDYKKLNLEERNEYFNLAGAILRNKVFQNEVNHYLADIINEIAKTAPDFRTVMDLRMSINGIQCLKERLESIEDPNRIRDSVDPLEEEIRIDH